MRLAPIQAMNSSLMEQTASIVWSITLSQRNDEENIDLFSLDKEEVETLRVEDEEEKSDVQIRELLEFIQNPIASTTPEYIDAIMALSEKSVALGDKTSALLNVLNDQEKIRLALMQKEMKDGLNDNELPYGTSLNLCETTPVMIIKKPISALYQELQEILITLQNHVRGDNSTLYTYKELGEKAFICIKTLQDMGKNPRYVISNKKILQGWRRLHTEDSSRMSKLEIEAVSSMMKNAVVLQKGLLQKRHEYYDSLQNKDRNSHLDAPSMAPLAKEVSKLNRYLENELENLPSVMTPTQKKHLEAFLPMFDEYYKDQNCALSGGLSYLGLDSKLKQVQQTIDEKSSIQTILEGSELLGNTMQHLYILHWLVESTMKHVLRNKESAGPNAKELSKKHGKSISKYSALLKAITFRNDIAHRGKIWGPKDFDTYILIYREAIIAIEEDYQLDYATMHPEVKNKTLSKQELRQRYEDHLSSQYHLQYDALLPYVDEKKLNRYIENALCNDNAALRTVVSHKKWTENYLKTVLGTTLVQVKTCLDKKHTHFLKGISKIELAERNKQDTKKMKNDAMSIVNKHFSQELFGLEFRVLQIKFGAHQIKNLTKYNKLDADNEKNCISAAGKLYYLAEDYLKGSLSQHDISNLKRSING